MTTKPYSQASYVFHAEASEWILTSNWLFREVASYYV